MSTRLSQQDCAKVGVPREGVLKLSFKNSKNANVLHYNSPSFQDVNNVAKV